MLECKIMFISGFSLVNEKENFISLQRIMILGGILLLVKCLFSSNDSFLLLILVPKWRLI